MPAGRAHRTGPPRRGAEPPGLRAPGLPRTRTAVTRGRHVQLNVTSASSISRAPASHWRRAAGESCGHPACANSPSVRTASVLPEPAIAEGARCAGEPLAAAGSARRRSGPGRRSGSAPSSRGCSSRRPRRLRAAAQSRSWAAGSGGPITAAAVTHAARWSPARPAQRSSRSDAASTWKPSGRLSRNARYQHARTYGAGWSPQSRRGSVTAHRTAPRRRPRRPRASSRGTRPGRSRARRPGRARVQSSSAGSSRSS